MGRIAARRSQRPLLARIFFLLAAALLPLWLLALADVRSVFALLVLVSKQIDAIAVLVFWVALGGLVHGRQGKRLFAPITAGGTLGEICGSFASAHLGRAFGIATLLPLAAARSGSPACWPCGRARCAGPLARGAAAPRRTPSAPPCSAALAEGRLFRILAVSRCSRALGPMLYFQFSYVADLATQGANGEQRLLCLYAVFRGWMHVGVLAIQVLGTSRSSAGSACRSRRRSRRSSTCSASRRQPAPVLRRPSAPWRARPCRTTPSTTRRRSS